MYAEEACSPARSGKGDLIWLSIKVLEREGWAARLKWQRAKVVDVEVISVLLFS